MLSTPRSLRLTMVMLGRTNVGKSSLLNLIAGQDVAIISPQAGTTTDVVEKNMELYPLGPTLWLDTAGMDDPTKLASARAAATEKAFSRADIAVIVTLPGVWGTVETALVEQAAKRNIKCVILVNQCDLAAPDAEFMQRLHGVSEFVICVSAVKTQRDELLNELKRALFAAAPEEFAAPQKLLGDLLPSGNTALFIVPVDIAAPKGRLILPQVQAIRDVLDGDSAVMVVKERQFPELIKVMNPAPALVVCDSQVVDVMIKHTPETIPATTFSILFSRLKGDMKLFLDGAQALRTLTDGDRILIAEACTHHQSCEDIGRVKLPRWLRERSGKKLEFEFCSGRDFPDDLTRFKVIVHCGSCMLNRRETLWRQSLAAAAQVPMTNYGMTISFCQGVLDRVIAVFNAK